VRRQQWRAADTDDKDAIKGTRFVLQKNPWNLSDVEQGKLTDVQRTNRRQGDPSGSRAARSGQVHGTLLGRSRCAAALGSHRRRGVRER
jgi:hypothetical protein